MSDQDAFVAALRAIDGQTTMPRHCTGHWHRMRIHGCVTRDAANVYHLTEEGRRRAWPTYGELRVKRERLNDAINNEGLGPVRSSVVLYKTRTARESLRLEWYTPSYDKSIRRPT